MNDLQTQGNQGRYLGFNEVTPAMERQDSERSVGIRIAGSTNRHHGDGIDVVRGELAYLSRPLHKKGVSGQG